MLTEPADAFGIATWPRAWHERGVASFEPDEIEQWERSLARGAGFVYALVYRVSSGCAPGRR